MFKKRICLSIISAFFITFLMGCSTASKRIKIGDEALGRGDYYAAALEYISVLDIKPKHGKALLKLSEIAESAYKQKLALAEGFRDQGNFESALQEYKDLSGFLGQLRKHNVLNFVPIDIDRVIRSVSTSVAEDHYSQAELFFKNKNFQMAIKEYRACLNLVRPYKDSREKIAESYYCIAYDCEKKRSYRNAANNYVMSFQTIAGYKDSPERAATLYYALGCYFLNNGYYRKAYEDLMKTREIDPQFKDVETKLAEARDLATIRIAFVRFDNLTGRNIAGMALGDFIFDAIKTKLRSQASQFIRIIDREELMALAQEQRINEGVLSSELSGPVDIEGVDFLIFGKLNQVRKVHKGLSKTRMTSTYDYYYEESYIDKSGKRKTRLRRSKEKMSFSLFRVY